MSLYKFTIIILPMRLVYTIINSEIGTSTSLFEEILVKLSITKKSIKYGRSGDRKQEYFFYWPDHTITLRHLYFKIVYTYISKGIRSFSHCL